MKTSKKDREQLREVAADYTGLGSLGIAPMLVVRLLDDLDTQESELTKLRKRVEVLERQIERAKSALTSISQDKWARNEAMKNYDCTVGEVADDALKYISESAKIAEGDE